MSSIAAFPFTPLNSAGEGRSEKVTHKKIRERKSLRFEAISAPDSGPRCRDDVAADSGLRRSQPPIRQTSKGSKPPSESLGRLRHRGISHREHHRTLRRNAGEFGNRAKIKRPEAVYYAGAEGQLDRPEHIAIV